MEFGSDPLVKSMFNASIGDGNLTLFWEDRWLGCDSPCLIAPELCKTRQGKDQEVENGARRPNKQTMDP